MRERERETEREKERERERESEKEKETREGTTGHLAQRHQASEFAQESHKYSEGRHIGNVSWQTSVITCSRNAILTNLDIALAACCRYLLILGEAINSIYSH